MKYRLWSSGQRLSILRSFFLLAIAVGLLLLAFRGVRMVHSLQLLLIIVFGAASVVFLSVEVRPNSRKQETKEEVAS